jgi:cation diffusion facilitator CzcD-associated flavoprotein CzcO
LDHVIARQHGGKTVSSNLVLCCGRCNQFKGPNIAGLDPISGKLTPLFHPRLDNWDVDFRWAGPRLIGKTAVGRTTIAVLAINLPQRLAMRRILMEEGKVSPD